MPSPRSPIAARRARTLVTALLAAAALTGCALAVEIWPDVVISTGSASGVSYPLGASVCRLFNLDTPRDGRRCVATPSAGPVANIQALQDGRTDIAIVPSDLLADAMGGLGLFAARGPDSRLRVLFTGHAAAFTIVARKALGIHSVADLRGKRINLGVPGSGERVAMERILAALGMTAADFAEVYALSPAEQHDALCANRIDAAVYSVGHPNGLIDDVLRMCGGVLLDVSGAAIERMLVEHPEYEGTEIPGGTYAAQSVPVQTVGVRSVVVTTTRLSEPLAYAITKAVFDNFADFRRLHPLFASLSVDVMVDLAGRAPIHPGAARYYRERGWTP